MTIAAGAGELADSVAEFFTAAVEESGVCGVQLSVVRDGRQCDVAAGWANAELGLPTTVDTVVQVGSVTKVFNAAMIMTLVEEGRLQLDVPVREYVSDLRLSDPHATQTITLRHLLSMSSGLDNGDYGDYGENDDAVRRRVEGLHRFPQHFEPGRWFGYSNAGADLAGHVAERVTGQVWDDLLRDRILRPAGLEHAVTLADDRLFHRVAVGHSSAETGTWEVQRPWSAITRGEGPGGGTFAASARDLARFVAIFLNGGVTEAGTRVLQESSVQTMMSPVVDVPTHYYGKSWCVGPVWDEWDGVGVWGHHGGATSGKSFVYWIPESGGAVAVTTNTMDPIPWARMVSAVTRSLMPDVFGVSKPKLVAPDAAVDLDPYRYVGTYEAEGGRFDVTLEGGRLRMRKVWNMFGSVDEEFSFEPLGEDRFLIVDEARAGMDLHVPDAAFFGTDEHGRATNMLGGVFPFSRRAG